jgi:hypothetical protein
MISSFVSPNGGEREIKQLICSFDVDPLPGTKGQCGLAYHDDPWIPVSGLHFVSRRD